MQYAKPVTLNVEECDRLSFLPYLFGNDFLYAEAYVYALAQKMMPEYQGGFWHFIRLPDGGGYIWQRFSVCRGVCVRAGAKNDAGISGRLLALHPPAGRWRLHDAGWRPFPHGERCKLV